MNFYDINTKEKLAEYNQIALVVTKDIQPSEYTGNPRAVALLGMETNFLQKEISLHVAIYELDSEGNPIINKVMKPYEELISTNGSYYNTETGENMFDTWTEKGLPQPQNVIDAYTYFLTMVKGGKVKLFDVFSNVIVNSGLINK